MALTWNFSVSGGSRAAHCGINPTFNAIHGGISQNPRNFLLKRRKLIRGALPPPILTDSFRLWAIFFIVSLVYNDFFSYFLGSSDVTTCVACFSSHTRFLLLLDTELESLEKITDLFFSTSSSRICNSVSERIGFLWHVRKFPNEWILLFAFCQFVKFYSP